MIANYLSTLIKDPSLIALSMLRVQLIDYTQPASSARSPTSQVLDFTLAVYVDTAGVPLTSFT